jgi:N-sulfoglucosamine sulfohydrolase
MMNRRGFIRTLGVGAAATMVSPEVFAQDAKRPNIVWLSVEDIGPMHGCYGDSVAVTPFIDRLAAEGVRYANAFTCAGVCAPSRYSIITGRYQTSDGAQHMRSGIGSAFSRLDYYARLPEGVRFFTSYLREAGYYCTNNSKEDYQVDRPEDAWDESSQSAHWRNRPDSGQPFFHVFNIGTTHESQVQRVGPARSRGGRGGEPPPNVHELPIQNRGQLPESRRVDPAEVSVRPYYPDTPKVRSLIAQNYDNVSTMDMQCEAVVKQLEKDGLADDTIVMYWSDHGGPLARGKRYVYDSGIHVPLIVRIPEKFRTGGQGKPGSVDDQLMSFVDFAPTVLNLAGVRIPANIHGRPFLGPGLGKARDFVYAARDRMDERYDTIRAVRDKRYKYIRNYEPHKPRYQYIDYAERSVIHQEIRRLDAAGALSGEVARMMASSKAAEELYDLEADPHEIENLADSLDHRSILERLRAAHVSWMFDTRDTGLLPEPIMIEESGEGSANTILRGDRGLTRLKKLRSAADAARAGQQDILMSSLQSDDDAIRYWAAIGLGTQDGAASDALVKAMTDASSCVRIAAAQSVARRGGLDRAKEPILNGLKEKSPWVRLMAALAIDGNEALAHSALENIRPYRKDESKYVARVVNRTLNRIEGTSESVR